MNDPRPWYAWYPIHELPFISNITLTENEAQKERDWYLLSLSLSSPPHPLPNRRVLFTIACYLFDTPFLYLAFFSIGVVLHQLASA
jgi:hypothetical protein